MVMFGEGGGARKKGSAGRVLERGRENAGSGGVGGRMGSLSQ